MISSFRQRLSKQEKETKRILLENKKLSTDQFNVQETFKECLEQLKLDKRKQRHLEAYQQPNIHSSVTMNSTQQPVDTVNQSFISGGKGGQHTQKRIAKRIQSAHARKASGATSTAAVSNRSTVKLTGRYSQPSKGIFVGKTVKG